MRRLLHAGAALACIVALGACRVDAQVGVTVDQSGGGEVTVMVTADQAVIDAAPDLVADLRLADLLEAGWQSDGPAVTPGGGATVTLTRPFTRLDDGVAILRQLSGPDGPFGEWTMTRNTTYGITTTSMSGSFRIADGLQTFADAKIVDLLGEAPLATQLQERNLTLEQVFGLNVTAALPGTATAPMSWTAEVNGAAASATGQAFSASATFGKDIRTAQRVKQATPWIVAAWGALFLGVIVPVTIAIGRLRRRRGYGEYGYD
jgi:hypothetical protein